MDLQAFASLVQLGFAGFVAAMALLSFKLMQQEIKRDKRDQKVIDQIHRYARHTLILSFVVLLGSITEGVSSYILVREKQSLENLVEDSENCRSALSGLAGAEGESLALEDLRQANRLAHEACSPLLSRLERLSPGTSRLP